ncbi:hypothetical protein GCM10010168_83690 [Actinoplanes ianthinogenes]|uniref:Lipoprotein n=1 Tax=Actinoplanes ianthinogenes TaxID=122358 RepID=A0ABM7M0H6_9ACTN|nr:hypothetical protein [Actinoplanes ianthinogenes]BCJ45057.1 hypothetical protein Aiant_57140 [Actinoplanes ianthinogenes]GGR52200.1 hypothetical protein GCM10010168_83690 [Actinoplanes ianthinogenes]
MKRFLAGTLAGVTALTLTVGCAKQLQQLEPKLAIQKAAEKLAATGKAGFTLKAGGSVDDLIALAKKESGTGEGAFTDEDADLLRKIYRSSFTVAWDKAGDGVADDKALINAVIDGVTGLEIRVVDQVAYVKAPVSDLAAKFGASAADIAEIRKEMGAAVPGVETLLDGGWVSVDAAGLKKLSEGSVGVAPSTDPAQNEKLAAEVQASAHNLIEGAEVVRDGKDDTHLVVTTSTVKAYTEGKRLVEAMATIAGGPTSELLDKSLGSELDKPPADKPIVMDLWVDDDGFKAFEINLLQFAEGSTGRATLRVDIASGADIAAPGDATKLDVAKIFEQIAGAGAGVGGPGGPIGPGGGAETWAGLLGSQAMLLAVSDGKPAAHLKEAARKLTIPGVTVKVVRRGVAEVTSAGGVACVTVPASTSGEPEVVAHAC